jgi:hypothetical protein
MSDTENPDRSESDSDSSADELQQELRKERRFSLARALGEMAGPGAMKGESPVTRLQQAETEIATWLRSHLTDSGGALQVVLHRRVKESDLLLGNFDHPLAVLADYCQRVLDSDYLLKDLVRATDVEWGRMMGERPFFDKEDASSHPDDPYTIDSTRHSLLAILQQLSPAD